jgi:hypothetical protein
MRASSIATIALATLLLSSASAVATTHEITVRVSLNHGCFSFGDDPHALVNGSTFTPDFDPWALPTLEPGDTLIVHIVPAAGGVFRVNTTASYPFVHFSFNLRWTNGRNLDAAGPPLTIDFLNLTGQGPPTGFSYSPPRAGQSGSDLSIFALYEFLPSATNVEFSEVRCTLPIEIHAPQADFPQLVLTPSSNFTFINFYSQIDDPYYGNPSPCGNEPPVVWAGVPPTLPANTPPGTNVPVTSADSNATVTFGTVSGAGHTTITTSSGACTAGGDFSVQQGAVNTLTDCYNINTTATYAGTILVSMIYTPPPGGAGGTNVAIWHVPTGGGNAVRLTTVATETLADGRVKITAETPGFSSFFVGYPKIVDHISAGAFAEPMGKAKKLGATMPLKLSLSADGTPLTTQAQLDAFLASHDAPTGCPEVRVYTAAQMEVELDETETPGADNPSTCFIPDGDGNWHFNLKLDGSFAPGSYEVQVLVGGSVFTPANRFFTAK